MDEKTKRKRKKGSNTELSRQSTLPYFAMRLRMAIDDWKQRTGGLQRELAARCNISQQSLNFYLRGERWPGDDIVNSLCRELKVTRDYFIPTSKADTYMYDPSRISKHQQNMDVLATQIGLDPAFCDLVMKYAGLTRSDIYAPFRVQPVYDDNLDRVCYWVPSRMDPAITEAVPDERYAVMVEKEGRQAAVLLSRTDLHIMKELQDKVFQYFQEFYKQQRELRSEQSRILLETGEDLRTDPTQVKELYAGVTYERACEIDPHMKDWPVASQEGGNNGKH